jgi:hypothetical protein
MTQRGHLVAPCCEVHQQTAVSDEEPVVRVSHCVWMGDKGMKRTYRLDVANIRVDSSRNGDRFLSWMPLQWWRVRQVEVGRRPSHIRYSWADPRRRPSQVRWGG